MSYSEPEKKKIVTFFDCQNLFLAIKTLWGYSFPNFDPVKLSKLVSQNQSAYDGKLKGIRLYTGIHEVSVNPAWHDFWARKLANHSNQDPRVFTYSRPLRYSNGVAREKGIDIRIALDLVRMARLKEYDIAVLFSQDADFSEVADEIRLISKEQSRWIKIASAFPFSPNSAKPFGVPKTDWLRISKEDYDSCIDPTDYRKKP
jgi:uncharacterized LabA/DUF88 family protein